MISRIIIFIVVVVVVIMMIVDINGNGTFDGTDIIISDIFIRL